MINNKVIQSKLLSLPSSSRLDADNLHFELSEVLDSENVRDSYLLKELLTKLPREGTSAKVRADNAITKMLQSEETCASINHNGYGTCTPRDYFESVMLIAQRKVSDILGDFSFSIFERATFSAGATVSRKRKYGDPFYKYHSTRPVSVTPGCYNYAYALISATPLWCAMGSWDNITLSIGNDVTTVPKKTEIDRTIAKEPCLNMALQRSVGTHIRGRLKRHGIDLDSQTRNQILAWYGSKSGNVATIDLAAASDSISRRLVQELLPCEWIDVLDKLRSHYGTLPNGKVILWEKFSSMGNGFTFELESMIFFAICAAVAEVEGYSADEVCVYGDDIIVPTDIARNVITVLSDIGFKTNLDKTFIEGPFRESCGKHYHDGIDITPFYMKSPINTVPRAIWFLNSLRKWATEGSLADPRVFKLWLSIKRRYIPSDLLGGNDFGNQGAVVSPEVPRNRLVLCPPMKGIKGTRALLRYFQYNIEINEGVTCNQQPLQFSDGSTLNLNIEDFDDVNLAWGKDPKWTQLPDTDVVQYTIKSNPDGDWWATQPCFPQEIAK